MNRMASRRGMVTFGLLGGATRPLGNGSPPRKQEDVLLPP